MDQFSYFQYYKFINFEDLLVIYPISILVALCLFFALRNKLCLVDRLTKLNPTYIFIFAAIVITSIVFFVLKQFPNSGDEYAYLFYSDLLVSDVPKVVPFSRSVLPFGFKYFDGDIISKYSSGWPLLLAFFAKLGLPKALLSPLLSIISLLLIYILTLKKYSKEIAIVVLLILVTSPFYLFNSAAYYAHLPCLTFILASYYSYELLNKTGKVRFLVLMLFTSCIALMIRNFTSFWMLLPLYFTYIRSLFQTKLTTLIVVLISTVSIVFVANFVASGEFFNDSFSRFHFTKNPFGLLTPSLIFQRWLKLDDFMFSSLIGFTTWSSPIILIGYFFYIQSRQQKTIFDYSVLVFFLAQTILFPWQSGHEYGARYFLEIFPFVVIGASVWCLNSPLRNFLIGTILVSQLFLSWFFINRLHEVVTERQFFFNLVEEHKGKNEIWIVKSHSGNDYRLFYDDLIRNKPDLSNRPLLLRSINYTCTILREKFVNEKIFVYQWKEGTEGPYLYPTQCHVKTF